MTKEQAIAKAACNAMPLLERLAFDHDAPHMRDVELVVFENGGWAICSGKDEGLQVASAPLSIEYGCVHDLEAALGEAADG